MSTVKLFPRLVMAHASQEPARHARMIRPHSTKPADRIDNRKEVDDQVRARLLRMIIENEQARRNERPNAS